jgi:hypothetical protein
MSAGQQKRQKHSLIRQSLNHGSPPMLKVNQDKQCSILIEQKFALHSGKNLRSSCGEKAFVS